jgi:hypothetical protein
MKTIGSNGALADAVPPASISAEPEPGPAPARAVVLPAEGPAEMAMSDHEIATRLAELPREAGWLLITAGMVGVVVPGIVGTPFLVAGAVVLAPGGPRLLSRWAGRNPPKFVRSAVRQMRRFLDDLDRRYPRQGLAKAKSVSMRPRTSQVN